MNQSWDRDDDVRRLLRAAGERPGIPARSAGELVEAARGAWQEAVAARRRAGRWRVLSAVASLVLLAGAAIWWRLARPEPASAPIVAQVERASGAATASRGGVLAAGAALRQGTELRTGEDGALSLRLAGRSLRVDAASEVTLEAADTVALVRGALYVDSGAAAHAGPGLAVETALGRVLETGTQFEVRVGEGAEPRLRVRVREGAVAVERQAAREIAAAGEEVTLGPGGAVTRGRIADDAAEWNWAIAAAPPFAIEGARLGDFLDWVARETAWRIEFEDAELESAARPILLHGTIEGLSPQEAVSAVVPGVGLEHEAFPGGLRISR